VVRGYNKTLKRNKEKTFDEGTGKYEKHKYAKTTLSIADLATAVICPEDELLNDWLAVHGAPSFSPRCTWGTHCRPVFVARTPPPVAVLGVL